MADLNHETRVKNALQHVVANNEPHSHTILPNTETKKTPTKRRKKDNQTIFVKNRFIHTRPLLISQSPNTALNKAVKGIVVQVNASKVSTNINTNQATNVSTINNDSLTESEVSTPPVAPCLNTLVLNPSIQAYLPSVSKVQVGCKQSGQFFNGSKIICPHCKTLNGEHDSKRMLKCLNCEKKFPVQLVESKVNCTQMNTNACAVASVNEVLTSTPVVSTISENKKRSNTTKVVRANKKLKPAETIDLVSSDDEHSETSEETRSSSLISGQKLQCGAFSEEASANLLSTPIVVQPTQLPNEYKFECNKAMFGELYGHAITPTNIAKNRIYLSLECSIIRDNTPVTEKYTLSVGQKDVKRVLFYFGRVPSLVAIETAERFSEVACQRIGKDVLVPNSEILQKRFIVLALTSAFKNDSDAVKELQQFCQCLSPWTRLTLLSHIEACSFIEQLKLDVCQKEVIYRNSPVQTLLVYPLPSKSSESGGIPITNEDLACLQDGIYLNDIIIDFYLKYIFENVLTPEQKEKTYIFNSYFYKRLTQKQSPKPSPIQMHDQVKKWTRNVDIFEKDFVVIPINEHSHWYLAIICFPGLTKNNSCSDEVAEEEDVEDESREVFEASAISINVSVNSCNNSAINESQSITDKLNNELTPAKASKSLVSYDSSPDSTSSINSTPSNLPEQNGNPELLTEAIPNHFEIAPVKESIRYKQANENEETFIRPCILIFDSLMGGGHSSVFTNLRNYISMEWINRKSSKVPKTFDKVTMRGSYPFIPRQNNDCDCGIFLLQYVESFFKFPITNFKHPVHLEAWFTLEVVANKRKEIQQIIARLSEEFNRH